MRSLMNDDGLPLGGLDTGGFLGLPQQLGVALMIALAEHIIVLILALTFFWAEHEPNNYGNSSLPMSINETSSAYSSCAEGEVFVPVNRVGLAGGMWFISFCLMVAVLYLDPQHGKSAEAMLKKTERKFSDKQILTTWLKSDPPRGHRGAMTFQINNHRRHRLHEECGERGSSPRPPPHPHLSLT